MCIRDRYGAALPGQHGNVLQLVANRLRNNEEVFVVSDQWRTPTLDVYKRQMQLRVSATDVRDGILHRPVVGLVLVAAQRELKDMYR